ncbi:hypothetical protein DAI12_00220 [Enterococcus faecalis]|nr:hypothetical protein DAI11_17490 [Enterococcus faecalis]PTN82933.1 hypothetical protein DAI10_17790 [Enterococcus faecalis]PTN92729.1 hypothetical protein DAI12_00220 [Enterococcus faecalis]
MIRKVKTLIKKINLKRINPYFLLVPLFSLLLFLLIFFILACMYKVIMLPSDVLFRVSSDLSMADFVLWMLKKPIVISSIVLVSIFCSHKALE